MLAHKFPRVRRFTADHLYVRLLEESEILRDPSDSETALQLLLLEAPWDSDMTVLEAMELSCRFVSMIGLELSWEAKASVTTMEKKTVDEFASYASLVNGTY